VNLRTENRFMSCPNSAFSYHVADVAHSALNKRDIYNMNMLAYLKSIIMRLILMSNRPF